MSKETLKSIRSQAPSDLAMIVKVHLAGHVGQDKRVSKAWLSDMIFGKYTTTTDRQIRDAVAELQETGELIVTDSDEGGYFYAASVDEVERYRQERRRAGNCPTNPLDIDCGHAII
jgi:hypothetical protein